MNLDPHTAHAAALALFLGPLLVATLYDLATYRIPNIVSASLAVAFPLAACLSPTGTDWISHIGAGALTLAVGAGLFAARVLGGGDAKLLAGAGLWMGFGNLLPLLAAVTLAGGAVTLLLLALRAAVSLPVAARVGRLPELLTKGGRVPYALAIAGGTVWMAGRLPL